MRTTFDGRNFIFEFHDIGIYNLVKRDKFKPDFQSEIIAGTMKAIKGYVEHRAEIEYPDGVFGWEGNTKKQNYRLKKEPVFYSITKISDITKIIVPEF